MKKRLITIYGVLIASFASIVIGTLRKLIGDAISTSIFAIAHYLIGAVAVIAVLCLFRKRLCITGLSINSKDFRYFIAIGFFLSLSTFSYFKALSTLPLNNVVFLGFMAPVFATLYEYFFMKEKIYKTTIIGIIIALFSAGLILDVGFILGDAVGNFFALLAPASFAVASVMLRNEERYYPLIDIVFWPFLFALMFVLPIPVIVGAHITATNMELGMLLVMGIAVAVLYYGFDVALKYNHAHTVTALIPVVSLILSILSSFFILGEPVRVEAVAGGILMILSAFIIGKESEKVHHGF